MGIRVIKSEWHQVEKRYGAEIDESFLSEVYPDLGEGEIAHLLQNIEEGIADVEDVLQDAYDADVELDWDWLDEDDWWTDRKGGYDVTYSIEE